MFGINEGEFLIIVVLALVLIGPKRLPAYLAQIRTWVHDLKQVAEGAKVQLREQMGPGFDDIDWTAYDPRQYDPRRIVREALAEPTPPTTTAGTGAGAGAATFTAPRARTYDPSRPTPFDSDAT